MSCRLRWYKAEPRAFFDATRKWPNELKANYRLVLDLIYAYDGALPDDDRWIAGELGLMPRAWRRIKAALVEMGKLYLADGAIHNPRADRDVSVALDRMGKAVLAGELSANKRRTEKAVSAENNDLAPTTVGETKIESKSLPLTETIPLAPAAPVAPPLAVKPEGEESAKAVLWREMAAFLGGGSARSFVGKLCGQYGEGEVFAAYFAARKRHATDPLAEPKSWLRSELARRATVATKAAVKAEPAVRKGAVITSMDDWLAGINAEGERRAAARAAAMEAVA